MNELSLIVFTGIDGSGKTTQTKLLQDSLGKDGVKVSYVWSRWEPFLLRYFIKKWKNNVSNNVAESSESEFKNEKRKLLNNPFVRWLWLAFFLFDYGLQIFIKVRIKQLGNNLVISDRISYDSIIDQAVNLGERKEWLLKSLDSFWMKALFPKPDLVFYVDCPEDIALSRKDDTPNIEYLKDRRKLYLKLADRFGWIKMDGTLPVSELADMVKNEVYKRLEK